MHARVPLCVLTIALAVAASGCTEGSEDTGAANPTDGATVDTTPAVLGDSALGDSALADSVLADSVLADGVFGTDSAPAVDSAPATDSAPAADTAIADSAVATDTAVSDTATHEVAEASADSAPSDTGAALDAGDAAPTAVCGNGAVESPEACEPASMSGLSAITETVARTFTNANHCSLRCENIVFSAFGTDIGQLGPAHPRDVALDRVLYARVSTNNWNPTGGAGSYDYRQYYRVVLPVKTRLDIYSMAANEFADGKWYLYSTGGTLYTSMELFTMYAADKTTRVAGFSSVRGNPDASPPYAASATTELEAGTYYLAIATPYWTTSKPSAFTVYTYIEQHPL